jgi:CheY-like chemotaxis protein
MMKPLSILVADDEAAIVSLMQKWLTQAGHNVICVADGAEAVRVLKSNAFDLVITDVVMPEIDGLEVIGALKKAQPSARILAISGGGKYVQGSDCLKMAKGLGAHAVATKPFTWEQLLAGINQAVPDQTSAAS